MNREGLAKYILENYHNFSWSGDGGHELCNRAEI